MARACRIMDQNILKMSGAVITPSSEEASFPARNLLDQLRSKVWRSTLGWEFLTGQNWSIDFNRGGAKNAVVAAGYYATGAAVAAAIVAALETADAVPVWACTYSPTTFKYTISSDLAFSILGASGGAAGESMLKDLGFAMVDTGSAVSQTAGEASYQSRHVIDIDPGSDQTIQAMWVLDHNVATAGEVKFVASDNPLIGNGLDDAPFVGFSQVLTGTDELRIGYNSQFLRYARFIIDDVQNTTGYAEVGIAYFGAYRQPSVPFSVSYQEEGDDLSEHERATEGALYGDLRVEAPSFGLEWLEVPLADADIFRAFRTATPKGKCFGFAFDAGVDNTDFVYGYRDGPLPIVSAGGDVYYTASFRLCESLS